MSVIHIGHEPVVAGPWDPETIRRAEAAIQSARTDLLIDAPFYGAIAMRLVLVAHVIKSQGTCATDGHGLFYNPTWILGLTRRQLVGLLAHEAMHVAHKHTLRREGRERREWNIACDLAINNPLMAAGFDLPEDGFCDRKFKGWAAEEVYAHRNPPKPPEPEPEEGESVCGGVGGSGAGESETNNKPEEGSNIPKGTMPECVTQRAGDEPTEGNGEGAVEGAGEQPVPEPQPEPMPAGGVLDSPDPVADESEIDVMIVQAGMCAKAAGKLPGDVQRLINQLTRRNDVNWADELSEFIVRNLREDYSMARPSKRYLAAGVYLPSLYSEAQPELAFGIDTSGSINEKQLARAVTVLNEAIEQARPERVHVKACDARVQWRGVFERGETLDVKTPGGGGTRFAPVFEELESEGVEPACAVYFTADCWAYDFGPEPAYPVLWICEPGHKVPPWGRVVVMDPVRA